MRADLDGFTAEVALAFEHGEKAIIKVVERFTGLMKFSTLFAEALRYPVIPMPWAGDCANLIILPDLAVGESYTQARGHVPPEVAGEWHDQTEGQDQFQRKWRDLLGHSDWVVTMAGGDQEREGSNGFLLVASIQTGTRAFKIAAGWSAKRSLDAHGAAGLRKNDTVVPKVDYAALDGAYKPLFKKLDSRFFRATKLSGRELRRKAIDQAAVAAPMIITSKDIEGGSMKVPKPRPHYVGE